ncbi:hypothetical protein BT67DRAFT_21737 [Trichocladium antarcticum]|uniref:Uncharacterized protein n=1 Tax=Trichocladium antarcticum TaxID=1450529 RepID=A0AAN6UTR5_9PEZI|nr:hypothetical protein BT67DRAFT_21737 [Trichocladium antarcticum]
MRATARPDSLQVCRHDTGRDLFYTFSRQACRKQSSATNWWKWLAPSLSARSWLLQNGRLSFCKRSGLCRQASPRSQCAVTGACRPIHNAKTREVTALISFPPGTPTRCLPQSQLLQAWRGLKVSPQPPSQVNLGCIHQPSFAVHSSRRGGCNYTKCLEPLGVEHLVDNSQYLALCGDSWNGSHQLG